MARIVRAAALTLAILVGSFLAVGVSSFFAELIVEDLFPSQTTPALERELFEAGVVLASLFVYFFVVILLISRRNSRRELGPIEQKLAELRGRSEDAGLQARAYIVLSEQKQLFAIARNHARYSFIASLSAISTGLVSILAAVFFLLQNGHGEREMSFLSGAAAVISEFIGGFFFVMHRSAEGRMNEIWKRLRAQEDWLLGLEEVEKLENKARKDELREKFIQSLLQVPAPISTVPISSNIGPRTEASGASI